ncbi:MAG: thiamine pyrophosphate-dependent enzyme [Porticoccaceae bacterium]
MALCTLWSIIRLVLLPVMRKIPDRLSTVPMWPRMINCPIMHVNGDDPEAVLFAASWPSITACSLSRMWLLISPAYRRLGHNEADEPSATQPIMYRKIKSLPTTRKLYGDSLVRTGVLARKSQTKW